MSKEKYGFDRNKIVNIDGTPVVYYTKGEEKELASFELKATIGGITLSGRYEINDIEGMRQFAEIVSDAWKDTMLFRKSKKITTTVSGH